MTKTGSVRMSVAMALDLSLCGLFIIGSGLLAKHLQPDYPPSVFTIMVIGGGLCIFWSIWGIACKPWRLGAITTVAMSAVWIAYHAVKFWRLVAAGANQTNTLPLLMLLLVYICGFTLFNLFREGITSAS